MSFPGRARLAPRAIASRNVLRVRFVRTVNWASPPRHPSGPEASHNQKIYPVDGLSPYRQGGYARRR
jgi:hypothetical protein